MLKHVALASLLAASCAANAATTWNFSYTGFFDQSAGVFSSDYRVGGSFTGQDANGDGLLAKDEITAFVLNGTDFIACGGFSNGYYNCGTDSFSFDIGTRALHFTAGEWSNDPEGYYGGGHLYESGVRELNYQFLGASYSESGYLWTANTQFHVAPAFVSGAEVPAVPEPGTWAMLATGLALVAGAALRRKQAATPLR